MAKNLVPDMMSSEDSDQDDDDLNINCVKILPWRSDVVKKFLHSLDCQYSSGKSSQAKRQTKPRIASNEVSSRPVPDGFPSWAIQ